MANEHWALLSIDIQCTDTGLRIIVETDTPSHLFMRWTYEPYWIHQDPQYRRGIAFTWHPRFCFVAYHDNEQEEAGDTFTHTFIKEPWLNCETRYFYFWGTINSNDSPSESPIFTHQRYCPVTAIFRPDFHPETWTVDGDVASITTLQTWEQKHDGPGDTAWPSEQHGRVRRVSSYTNDRWEGLFRFDMLFDTSLIPTGSIIQSAELWIHGETKTQSGTTSIAPAVYRSYPFSNVNLVPLDYQRLDNIPLSNAIPFDDLIEEVWNIFTLNQDGLDLIIPGSITKLALRDSLYDAPNIKPLWEPGRIASFIFKTMDFGLHVWGPMLIVTYLPPPCPR